MSIGCDVVTVNDLLGFSGRNFLQTHITKTHFLPSIGTGVDSSMVEQRPFKSLVEGSNPSRPTTIQGLTLLPLNE